MKIKDILSRGRPAISFEVFPSKKDVPLEPVKVAVQHFLRVAGFVAGAQILDAALVQHITAYLVPPADIGFAVFQFLLLLLIRDYLATPLHQPPLCQIYLSSFSYLPYLIVQIYNLFLIYQNILFGL